MAFLPRDQVPIARALVGMLSHVPSPSGANSHLNFSVLLTTHRLTDLPTPQLRPPRLRGGLPDDDLFEKIDGAGEPFVDAHQRVLVLDGDNAVVTRQAQLADQ